MKILNRHLLLALPFVAIVACSQSMPADAEADYHTLLTAANQLDRAKAHDARTRCEAAPLDEQSTNPWCLALHKAANCAANHVCPAS